MEACTGVGCALRRQDEAVSDWLDYIPVLVFAAIMILVAVLIYSHLDRKARACVERGGTIIYMSGSYAGCVEKK